MTSKKHSLQPKLIVTDDVCPEKSGAHVKENGNDPRVEVLFHRVNFRVGGAVKSWCR